MDYEDLGTDGPNGQPPQAHKGQANEHEDPQNNMEGAQAEGEPAAFDKEERRRQVNNPTTTEEIYHISNILKHYAHAREKHPYFCDIMLPFLDGFSLRNQKQAYACALKSSRDSIVAGIHDNTLSWNTLLDCEMWEALDALINGDTAHAIEECYDAIAVLLRTIDVLEGRQKLGKLETKGAK